MLKHIYITVAILLSTLSCWGQKNNPDSLYLVARTLAYSGQYEECKVICDSILSSSPEYIDVILLKGRAFAWDKQPDNARDIFLSALAISQKIEDVYMAIVDNELWAGNYGKAEKYCKMGLNQFPKSFPLLLKLAQIQYNLIEYNQALTSVDSALAIVPEDEPALKLRDQILSQLKQDRIQLSHSIEWFDVPFKRQLHITTIEYTRKIRRWTIIPRQNFGQALYDTSVFLNDIHPQAEMDVYYQLSGWNYLFFNYGYAPLQFFPRHRHGLEIFQKLPLGFEISLGYRFLYFKPETGSNAFIDIYTASIGKYWKSFWFAGRTYITPKSKGIDNSYQILGRYFINTVDDFVELSYSSGFAVDESIYAQQTFQSPEYLQSHRIGLRWQYKYKHICLFHAGAAIRFEEYFQKSMRKVYFVSGGVSFLL